MSRLLTRALTIAWMFLIVLAPPAIAHDLLVISPGGRSIDVGSAEPARLLHATLIEASDQLVVQLQPPSAANMELLLLVPDRQPERRADPDALPAIIKAPGFEPAPVEEEVILDEVTGLQYRVLERQMLREDAASAALIVVGRGSSPTRAVVRIGAPDFFATEQPQRTPRTLARLREWYESPAAGSAAPTRGVPKTTGSWSRAAYGAGIAIAAMLLAIWWVRSGKRRSREQGARNKR